MKIPPIETHDGRRAWAFLAILGGCVTMTLFAAVGVFIVRGSMGLSFWLAMAAHGQIFVGLSAMGWAMGRRMQSEVTRSGIKFDDRKHDTSLEMTSSKEDGE